jgi:asparagine synthase (glutamine-hydrolysing)
VKLADVTLSVEINQVSGMIVEAGCAMGGSSIVIASAKAPQREMSIHDVFGMIPRPSEKDGADVHHRYRTIESGRARGIKGKPYYGYVRDLQKEVVNNFRECGYVIEENNIRLVKGLLQDTLEVNRPISLAHIDVDWYEPVYFALQQIEPWLSSGGAIILDDYHYWSGCRTAVDNYFSSKRNAFELDDSAGSLVVVKL